MSPTSSALTMKPARVLIWGAGAIGGIVGAYLARAGHDVTMVDIAADHVATVQDPRRGLRIIGPIEEFTVTVPAATPDAVAGTWDCVLLAVKAHHTEEACRALQGHLDPSGYVVSLQNGLCETVIAGILGAERTVGCFVNFAGDWLEPGLIRYGQRGVLALGELDGQITPRLEGLVARLREFEPNAFATDDIWSFLWGKLGFAALLYGTALCSSAMAELLERRELLPVWRALCGEVMAVAAAEGVQPRGFDGFRPEAFMPGAGEAETWSSVEAMLQIMRPSAKTHSGYWRDIAVRKRRTEVDVQIVPILGFGERHGLSCPTLRRLVQLIHALEDGELDQADDNLRRLSANLVGLENAVTGPFRPN